MYVVTVEFSIEPKHGADFRDAVLAQARNSLDKEAACHRFDVCFPADALTACFLYEIYGDEAAFQTHLRSEHFKAFDDLVSGWVTEKTVKTWALTFPAAGSAHDAR